MIRQHAFFGPHRCMVFSLSFPLLLLSHPVSHSLIWVLSHIRSIRNRFITFDRSITMEPRYYLFLIYGMLTRSLNNIISNLWKTDQKKIIFNFLPISKIAHSDWLWLWVPSAMCAFRNAGHWVRADVTDLPILKTSKPNPL